MAIISPADLPVVLRVRSDAMKAYCLAKLGFPHVDVEISEQQFEIVLKNTGDFIAGYFPREQKFAIFYTTPLQSTYPMPEDAYWIQEVSWDPITTRIDDVFGAESFLFCWPGGTHLLTVEGPKTCEEIAQKKCKVITPFGPREPKIKWNEHQQPIQILKTKNDYLICTPNHPVNLNDKFRMAIEGFPGTQLFDSDNKSQSIIDRDRSTTTGTWSVSTDSGCYYASALGKEFYLVH